LILFGVWSVQRLPLQSINLVCFLVASIPARGAPICNPNDRPWAVNSAGNMRNCSTGCLRAMLHEYGTVTILVGQLVKADMEWSAKIVLYIAKYMPPGEVLRSSPG
jgi:hypothetical protein